MYTKHTVYSEYESDPSDAIRQLETLAEIKNINNCVRLGDIYAVIATHNARKGNFKKVIIIYLNRSLCLVSAG